MKKLVFLALICFACGKQEQKKNLYDFTTVFEQSNGLETATYSEIIRYYSQLAETFPQIKLQSIGTTDSGEPLHLVSFSAHQKKEENTITLLINNGIHPGESDGIDATMMLFRDLATGKLPVPKNVSITTIPVYNVGGSLNRNTGTRANQNGPKEYGFRGNARNYDLNRDFIKSDTRNAQTFARIFHQVDPDVFIDNHVSNGADYQYTLTHLFTQHNKLGGPLGTYLHEFLMPELTRDLGTKKLAITPYVNVWGTKPEAGWSQFMDYPRYSTGYTTLFNSLGMMVETHMLKPYKDRVEQTYELMESMITIIDKDAKKIKKQRAKQFNYFNQLDEYTLDWTIDSTQTTRLKFKGYEGRYIPSEVTGKQRLFYDKDKPFTKDITYYNYMKSKDRVTIPKAYIIPKSWHRVISQLALNKIEMTAFKKDTLITVEAYEIANYQTRKSPYEGHYLHYNTHTDASTKAILFRKGDYLVKTHQAGLRYLLETLEPSGPDSFFNWNYFDTILQQKEHFSPYVFEDTAKELLARNSELKAAFEKKLANDEKFERNGYAQLNWIYEHSKHHEEAYMRYPIYRVK